MDTQRPPPNLLTAKLMLAGRPPCKWPIMDSAIAVQWGFVDGDGSADTGRLAGLGYPSIVAMNIATFGPQQFVLIPLEKVNFNNIITTTETRVSQFHAIAAPREAYWCNRLNTWWKPRHNGMNVPAGGSAHWWEGLAANSGRRKQI